MLYHPDRGEQFRKSISTSYSENDFENLTKYSHILLISDIDNVVVTTIDEDIGYSPEYTWDTNQTEGYSFVDPDETTTEEEFDMADIEKSFYNAIKMREYGTVNIEFTPYYLEDIEDFELSYSGIETLDGVEHCKHVVILDVSNNELSDISNLWDLNNLEELYLANNQIGYIDTLSNLLNLRVIDLSGNQIDDITPILELERLENLNLIGNPIPKNQIEKLKEKGIIVMY